MAYNILRALNAKKSKFGYGADYEKWMTQRDCRRIKTEIYSLYRGKKAINSIMPLCYMVLDRIDLYEKTWSTKRREQNKYQEGLWSKKRIKSKSTLLVQWNRCKATLSIMYRMNLIFSIENNTWCSLLILNYWIIQIFVIYAFLKKHYFDRF